MEKRKRQQTDGATAARSYFAAEREADTARQQAEFDAAQRSRRILDEEKAKDRAWREAVLKVSIMDDVIWLISLHPVRKKQSDCLWLTGLSDVR